ncbi:homocysteine S-methyltransferase family protein [Atrimonas thermophila]|uniref:homocysteine S-methyltransferase family protein n=1 Tax=Atrimonas thermophila TaxID=3064161 RepID=UPI00399C97A1
MLRERLKKGIVVFDGAMGTRLQERGLKAGHPPDEWNISHPEEVLAVHISYVEAGSDMIQTNTFGSNRLQLKRHGLEDRIKTINQKAVQIAKEALRENVLLASSIGPLGEFLEPFGDLTREKARDTFREQMEILREEGITIFHLETFSSLQEALIAVEVALELKAEIIVSLTFQKRGDGTFTTLMGETPQRVSFTLQDLPVAAIGSNCGTGIHEMLFLVQELRKHYQEGFISCKPNAGIPRIEGDKILYTETPQDFAQVTQELIKVPVNIIGGCCGTTAEHIKAIRKTVDDYSASKRG